MISARGSGFLCWLDIVCIGMLPHLGSFDDTADKWFRSYKIVVARSSQHLLQTHINPQGRNMRKNSPRCFSYFILLSTCTVGHTYIWYTHIYIYNIILYTMNTLYIHTIYIYTVYIYIYIHYIYTHYIYTYIYTVYIYYTLHIHYIYIHYMYTRYI